MHHSFSDRSTPVQRPLKPNRNRLGYRWFLGIRTVEITTIGSVDSPPPLCRNQHTVSFSKLRLAWLRQYRIAVAGMIELQTIATDTVAPAAIPWRAIDQI